MEGHQEKQEKIKRKATVSSTSANGRFEGRMHDAGCRRQDEAAGDDGVQVMYSVDRVILTIEMLLTCDG